MNNLKIKTMTVFIIELKRRMWFLSRFQQKFYRHRQFYSEMYMGRTGLVKGRKNLLTRKKTVGEISVPNIKVYCVIMVSHQDSVVLVEGPT